MVAGQRLLDIGRRVADNPLRLHNAQELLPLRPFERRRRMRAHLERAAAAGQRTFDVVCPVADHPFHVHTAQGVL